MDTANLFFVLVLLVCVGMHSFFGHGHVGHAHGESSGGGLGQEGNDASEGSREDKKPHQHR